MRCTTFGVLRIIYSYRPFLMGEQKKGNYENNPNHITISNWMHPNLHRNKTQFRVEGLHQLPFKRKRLLGIYANDNGHHSKRYNGFK